MPIGINKVEKLIKKTSEFTSTHTKGMRMINERYFMQSKGISYNPDIETQKIMLDNKTISEFSSKIFPNGDRFEVYRLPEGTVKILKNRFGEIKNFSNSNKNSLLKPDTALEYIRSLFYDKIQEFLV